MIAGRCSWMRGAHDPRRHAAIPQGNDRAFCSATTNEHRAGRRRCLQGIRRGFLTAGGPQAGGRTRRSHPKPQTAPQTFDARKPRAMPSLRPTPIRRGHLRPLARQMTDYAACRHPCWRRSRQVEGHCLNLSDEAGARAAANFRRLRIEQRDLAPRVVHDEYEANRESERLIAEGQRLRDAITAQTATCERLERRLRAEERVVAAASGFCTNCPPVRGCVRWRANRATSMTSARASERSRTRSARLQRLPVPCDDLAERIRRLCR